MGEKDRVLADTSVWVKYLRDARAVESTAMHELLKADRVVMCGPVLAEILSGSRDRASHDRMKELMLAIPCLEPSSGIWVKMGEARFVLARKGIQQSLIDLWIAVVAHEHGVSVWTLDHDFKRIRSVIPFKSFTLHG